jgi:hypothetical protein
VEKRIAGFSNDAGYLLIARIIGRDNAQKTMNYLLKIMPGGSILVPRLVLKSVLNLEAT